MSTNDAEHFAGIVGHMLRDELKPILDRLKEGDERFGRIEKTLKDLANEIAKANAAMAKMPEFEAGLRRVESLCPRCRESLVSVPPNGNL